MSSTGRHAKRFVLLSVGIALWSGALYASLRLHTVDLPIAHNLCGPWGCAAEPEALLGYHAFWAMLLVPAIGLACRVHRGRCGRRLGTSIGIAGLLGILAIFGHGATTWARAEGTRYAVQRGLFDVATTPDVPVMPLAIGGIVGLAAAGHRTPTEARPVESAPAG